MAMELHHTFTVDASPEDTWALLMNLEEVGNCFPGATVTSATEEAFTGNVKVKLGPIGVTYQGEGKFLERDDEAHRAVIEGLGKGMRGLGNASATVTLELEPDGSGTKADVTTLMNITGKPAQFGRGVMQSVSDKLLGQFVECIEGKLAGVSRA